MEITSKAFLLRPDTPEEGEERKPRPGEPADGDSLSPHLAAMAEDAGLNEMKRPRRRPNSLRVLQAVEHAKRLGKGDEVRDSFYKAYWDDGLDVGQMDVIRQVSEPLGIEWEPLAEALAENRYLDTVMGEFQEGMDLGFNAIPAFVIGDVGFMGAQPLDVFRQLADRATEMLDRDPETFNKPRRVL